jgi:multidrug efflux pump subunit AcrB
MLRSYAQPLVIMTAVPMGIIGAVAGHWVMGYQITMFSLFGVVALSGVVVNDSLVLLDQINRYVREGRLVRQAVEAAGEARFRAVILTSVTTVAGLLPLLSERSTQAQTLIPMAISLAFGLTAATALTLIFVPTLFLVVNDLKRAVRWLRRGGPFPTAESVELAEGVPLEPDSA